MDACALNATVSSYLSSLALDVETNLANREALVSDFLSNTAAQTTTFLIGGAFLFSASVLFGRYWSRHALVAVGAVLGACAANELQQRYALLSMLPVAGDGACLASLGALLGSGALAAMAVLEFLSLGYFALGAAGAYVLAQVGLGALSLSSHPYAGLGTAALAVCGGLYFVNVADALIDTALGALGSFLLAQGGLAVAVAHQDDLGLVLPAALKEHELACVVGLAAALFLARQGLIRRRSQGRKVYLAGGDTPLLVGR